jgi:hypothetical protein
MRTGRMRLRGWQWRGGGVGRILRRGEIFRDYILYWVVWRFGFTKNRMYSLALGVGWMDGEKKEKGVLFLFLCWLSGNAGNNMVSLFFLSL